MKKFISILLLLAMCLSLFAACADKDTGKGDKNEESVPSTTAPVENVDLTTLLPNAIAYLKNMYQTVGKDEVIVLNLDKDVLSVVSIGGTPINVEWSIAITEGPADSVKIIESAKENHVKIDIPDQAASDIKFTATATVKDEEGQTKSISFNYMVKAAAAAGLTYEQIVEEAYKLENGAMMDGSATLEGKITLVKTPYDPSYENITVVIQIGDLKDKKIECYRLKGDGAADLAIGDTIKVTGVLKNYNGTIEFDAGCVLESVVKGEIVTAPTDPVEIVNAAYALESGDSLPYEAKLTGIITSIKTPWDDGFGNISVIIVIEGCEDKPILCYRMKGDGAATLAPSDTITCTGFLTNYNGTIEFTAGCLVSDIVKGDGTIPEIPEQKPDPKPDPKPDTPAGDHLNFTVDTLALPADKYTSATGSVGGIGIEWIQLGNYGNGIQMRDKDGNTSMFWNTSALPNKITKIEFTFNSEKKVYDGNNMIVNFGKTAKGADCAMTLTTVADKTTYTITPNGDYKFFYIEWDTGYSSYWDSIKVYCEGVTTTPNTPSQPSEPSQPSQPSQPSTPSEPSGDKVTVADGNYIIYVPAYNMALSSEYTGFYNKGVEFTSAGATEIWTITNNADGTVCISVNGQKLAMGDSYSSMPLGEKNDKWVIVDAGNGLVYIQNVARGLYVEWYADKSNWSAYGTIGAGKEGMFAIKLVAA